MAEPVPSATTTPHSTSHVDTEQRWANAGENLAVLNFSEKVCFKLTFHLHRTLSKSLKTSKDAPHLRDRHVLTCDVAVQIIEEKERHLRE